MAFDRVGLSVEASFLKTASLRTLIDNSFFRRKTGAGLIPVAARFSSLIIGVSPTVDS
jgi:hypothetical protein